MKSVKRKYNTLQCNKSSNITVAGPNESCSTHSLCDTMSSNKDEAPVKRKYVKSLRQGNSSQACIVEEVNVENNEGRVTREANQLNDFSNGCTRLLLAENNDLKSEVNVLKAEVNELKFKNSQLSTENEQIQKDLDEQKKLIQQLETELSKRNDELQKYKKQLESNGSSQPSTHISVLPDELFLKIFSYLTMDELLSTQFVCTKWQEITRDNCLWEEFVFDTNDLSAEELTTKLQIIPALKSIVGSNTPNSIVDVMINNVASLHRMECIFDPPMSASQVERIIQKYSDLASVYLEICSVDFPICVRFFANSKNLTELLYEMCDDIVCPCYSNAFDILNILKDNENFPSLKVLDMTEKMHKTIADKPIFKNLRPDIIANRSDQLTILETDLLECESTTKFLEALHRCVNLEQLILSLSPNQFSKISFDKFIVLDALHIELTVKTNSILPENLYTPLTSRSWANLSEFQVTLLRPDNDIRELKILKIAIENMRNLKRLMYDDMSYETSEEQLQQLRCLSKLKYLRLNGLVSISETGFQYLSTSLNLKELGVISRGLHTELSTKTAEMVKSMHKLESLDIRVLGLFSLIFQTRDEIVKFFEQFPRNDFIELSNDDDDDDDDDDISI